MDGKSIDIAAIPQTAVTNGLKVKVSLKPTLDSTDFTLDDIFDQYAEDIARGAKYRLQMSPKKPYTDVNMATANKQLFDQFINQTADQVARSFMDLNISYEPLV